MNFPKIGGRLIHGTYTWDTVCVELKTKFAECTMCWGQLASMAIIIICLLPQYIARRMGCKISTFRPLCLLQPTLPLLSLFSCISHGGLCFLLPSGTHMTATHRALIHEYMTVVTHCKSKVMQGVQSFIFPLFCSSKCKNVAEMVSGTNKEVQKC